MRTHPAIPALVCAAGLLLGSDAGASCLADHASRTASTSTGLPPNIAVASDLEETVTLMLSESPTFRRQCRRLGTLRRIRVRVLVEDAPTDGSRRAQAQSDLARYEYGSVKAVVRLWLRANAVELIAHEFEHILEVAEGMNYRVMARRDPGQIWAVNGGKYESARAIEVGLQVKRELAHATRPDRVR